MIYNDAHSKVTVGDLEEFISAIASLDVLSLKFPAIMFRSETKYSKIEQERWHLVMRALNPKATLRDINEAFDIMSALLDAADGLVINSNTGYIIPQASKELRAHDYQYEIISVNNNKRACIGIRTKYGVVVIHEDSAFIETANTYFRDLEQANCYRWNEAASFTTKLKHIWAVITGKAQPLI